MSGRKLAIRTDELRGKAERSRRKKYKKEKERNRYGVRGLSMLIFYLLDEGTQAGRGSSSNERHGYVVAGLSVFAFDE